MLCPDSPLSRRLVQSRSMEMFARYTEPARRAIFFARAVALYSEHGYIEPLDLLRGLIYEGDRAQTIFNLREFFPMYKGHPAKSTNLKVEGPPLDHDSRQVLREISTVGVEKVLQHKVLLPASIASAKFFSARSD